MSTSAAAKVIADALGLSDEERAAVAAEILASQYPTEPDSPEAAAAFKAELDRRRAAYHARPHTTGGVMRDQLRRQYMPFVYW